MNKSPRQIKNVTIYLSFPSLRGIKYIKNYLSYPFSPIELNHIIRNHQPISTVAMPLTSALSIFSDFHSIYVGELAKCRSKTINTDSYRQYSLLSATTLTSARTSLMPSTPQERSSGEDKIHLLT